MDPRLWDDDDELLAALAEALHSTGPLVPDVAAAGRGAYTWRTVDAELAALVEPLEAVGVRAADTDTADFQFEVDVAGTTVTVEMEVRDGEVVGQLIPAVDSRISAETLQGTAGSAVPDEVGCFSLTVPGGPLRLRITTPGATVVTDWVRP